MVSDKVSDKVSAQLEAGASAMAMAMAMAMALFVFLTRPQPCRRATGSINTAVGGPRGQAIRR